MVRPEPDELRRREPTARALLDLPAPKGDPRTVAFGRTAEATDARIFRGYARRQVAAVAMLS